MRNEPLPGATHTPIAAASTAEAEAPAQTRVTDKPGRNLGARTPATGPPLPFDRPAYMSVATWCTYTGMNRTAVYEAVAFGRLTTIKIGKRRLVDVEQGLVWLRSLSP